MMGGNQDAPATKPDLASVERSLARDFENLRNELRQDVAELRIHAVRQDVRNQFESIGHEITRDMRALVANMEALRRELRRELRTIKWMLAAVLAILAPTTVGTIALALS